MKTPTRFFTAGMLACLLLPFTTAIAGEIAEVHKTFSVNTGKALLLDLDIDAGELVVKRNAKEDELAVRLRFSKDAFDYDLNFAADKSRLALDFDKKNWIKDDAGHFEGRIELQLPAQALLELRGRIKAADIRMLLGDLTIRRFDVKLWAGDVKIDFDRENRQPMLSFDLNTKVGSTTLRRLGNARFHYAEINSGIGDLYLDFSGALEPDASAYIDLDVGETSMYLPKDTGIKLIVDKFLFLSQVKIPTSFERVGKLYLSENYDRSEQKFEVKVAPGIGSLSVHLR